MSFDVKKLMQKILQPVERKRATINEVYYDKWHCLNKDMFIVHDMMKRVSSRRRGKTANREGTDYVDLTGRRIDPEKHVQVIK